MQGVFGVYDGHGGSKAAQFVAEKLHGNIKEMLDKVPENGDKEEAVKLGYLKTDQDFLKQVIMLILTYCDFSDINYVYAAFMCF